MIPSPIGRVLSILKKHRVRALLMGGQACVVYGAAEFSRDIDLAVEPNERNLDRLRAALEDLRAEPVFVPPLSRDFLIQGHACHFRARMPDADGLRVDVMSVMRGCDSFGELWARRRRVNIPPAGSVHVMGLADLVRAKKTQRDKDWPMLRRLVEADYHQRSKRPSANQIDLWLREARTPEFILKLVQTYPGRARRIAPSRVAVQHALDGKLDEVGRALRIEEDTERAADRAYWAPLRAELAQWRSERDRNRRRS